MLQQASQDLLFWSDRHCRYRAAENVNHQRAASEGDTRTRLGGHSIDIPGVIIKTEVPFLIAGCVNYGLRVWDRIYSSKWKKGKVQ